MPLRQPKFLGLVVLALLCCSLVCAPSSFAAETLSISNGVSDNYKAVWNANPNQRELRTYLSFDVIQANQTTWRPRVPAAHSFTKQLAVHAADGRTGTVTVRELYSQATADLRYDPDSRWGVLMTLRSGHNLKNSPLFVEIQLTVSGTVVAKGYAQYRFATFAGTGSNLEHNGPAGRWHIGAVNLPTDWETNRASSGLLPAPLTQAPGTQQSTPKPAQPKKARPKITRTRMPVRTTKRNVRLSVTTARGNKTARVTHIRVRVGAGKYSRWLKLSSAYRIQLAAATKTHTIRIQARDSRGVTSLVKTRRIRCLCANRS